jgi:acetyl-CoA synthetase
VNRTALSRLLSPKSIAVVGGKEAAEVIHQCERIGFSGPIWPINPRRAEIEKRPTFASISDLPSAPDAAFIAVPRHATVQAVDALAMMGAGGAVCYAAGFSENGGEGEQLQRDLVAASREMAIVGPNCYGFLNYLDGAALWPDQHGGARVERGVAIVTQSGNIGLNLTMQTRALPLAYLVTIGNRAKGDFGDYIDALLADNRVTAIGLHIEALDDIINFADAAMRARAKGIPIVAIKAGRSAAGAALTLSHTASLAGENVLYGALFARCCIATTDDLSTFLDTLALLHVVGPLTGRRLSSMSCSGGEAALVADLAEMYGLVTPPFSPSVGADLQTVLGPSVNVSNPLDYHTFIWGDRDQQAACFNIVLRADFDINLLILDFPRPDRCDSESWQTTLSALELARSAVDATVAVASSLPETLPEWVGERLQRSRIIPLHGLNTALAAISCAASIAERWREPPTPALRSPSVIPRNVRLIGEAEAKEILSEHGLPVPQGLVVPLDRVGAAASLIGFPVVIKSTSLDVAHKTEVAAVKLNVINEQEAIAAARSLQDLSRLVLVEKMVEGSIAELLIGVVRNRHIGLSLTLAAGGIHVELFADSVTLILPVSRYQIAGALKSLKSWKLISGYRGRSRGDVTATIEAIAAVANYAMKFYDSLEELDINPLLILPEGKGVFVVDALLRLGDAATSGGARSSGESVD